MWAGALAEKEQKMEVVGRLSEGGMTETKMKLATLMKQLLFGCNAGITESLYGRIIIYFHRVAAV